ncbi:MAG: folylpolyglutamate synthase/dihydrofolate synthase family protein [Gammaproteobacteria bacterium]
MRFHTLDEWLDWQLTLHDKSIELGLERVATVAAELEIESIAGKVITVAGTNGKGSTVACYENWLHRAGYSVASYTSPHLLRYNERIKLNTRSVSDDLICKAFEAIDIARGGIALTYFEFGTLAALWIINRHQPDYAMLEVGLGGRLDAVNIIDADMVHLTSIGMDHQSWLGDTREKIGYEKAGVLRAGIPVVCNDRQPPRSVLDEIKRLDCRCLQYQRDFDLQVTNHDGSYEWRGNGFNCTVTPPLPGVHQIQNLAGVIAGLSLLFPLQQIGAKAVAQYFAGTELPGRFQRLDTDFGFDTYVDVGHNHDAAIALAKNLELVKRVPGKLVILFGMLEDKESTKFVAELKDIVDEWWLLSLDCDRGLDADRLAERIGSEVSLVRKFANSESALDHALSSLSNQDIMMVTGSFVTVEIFLQAISKVHAIQI